MFRELKAELRSEYKRMGTVEGGALFSDVEARFYKPAIDDAWANTVIGGVRWNRRPDDCWHDALWSVSEYMGYWSSHLKGRRALIFGVPSTAAAASSASRFRQWDLGPCRHRREREFTGASARSELCTGDVIRPGRNSTEWRLHVELVGNAVASFRSGARTTGMRYGTSRPMLSAHCVLESPIMAGPSFDITCPRCGHRFQELTQRLLANLSVICPGCGGEIDVKFKDERGLEATTEVGPLQVKQSLRGSVTYSVEVQNRGLNKHRLIRGSDPNVVKAKVECQVAEWNGQWARRAAAKRQMTMAERRKEEAAERTTEAQAALQALREVLSSSLAESKAIDWEALKDKAPFPRPAPTAPDRPPLPTQVPIPEAPSRSHAKYQPQIGLLDKLITSRRAEKESSKAKLFESDTREWEATRDRLTADHAARLEVHSKELANIDAAHKRAVEQWGTERVAFLTKQREQHEAIAAFRARYERKEPAAISEYCEMVLASSEYPACLPKEFDLDFNQTTGILVVNYRLPGPF